jgi:hypothetical protein
MIRRFFTQEEGEGKIIYARVDFTMFFLFTLYARDDAEAKIMARERIESHFGTEIAERATYWVMGEEIPRPGVNKYTVVASVHMSKFMY